MELGDFFNSSQPPDDLLQMQSYLQGARRTPTMGYANLPEGMTGFYKPADNLIGVLPYQSKADEENTAMHEYAHAVKSQIERQFNTTRWKELNQYPDVTSLDKLFTDAYLKFAEPTPSLSVSKVKDPEYRWNNRSEARAFGIANMNVPNGVKDSSMVPPHYDASAAQEHSILLDLAQKAALQPRQTPPSWYDKHIGTLKDLFK